jgi:hypothetical protein
MSLFNNPIYDYWQIHVAFIWQIKNLQIGDGLLGIIDQRARKLLIIVKQLSENPNTQISVDGFDYVPASYEDIYAVAMIINQHLEGVKCQVINRNIIYLP